jgi:hypothetical protein
VNGRFNQSPTTTFEAEAYLRITAGRAAREHPVLLAMLADGRLHLSGIAKLAPHLAPENRDELLRRACHRSKREIEVLLAELFPRPDVPTLVRKLPVRRPSAPAPTAPSEPQLRPNGVAQPRVPAPAPVFLVEPLAPARYKVQFTASAELQDKLERLRSLTRSQVPDGDLATIIERSASATATSATTGTSKVGGAPNATRSSITMFIPLASAAITAPRTFD